MSCKKIQFPAMQCDACLISCAIIDLYLQLINAGLYCLNLKDTRVRMEAADSCKILVPVYKTAWCHIPEAVVIEVHSKRRKNVKLVVFRG
jgi:hypothetical protein